MISIWHLFWIAPLCGSIGFLAHAILSVSDSYDDYDNDDDNYDDEMAWVDCKECIYFEDCNEKEARDECYFGMTEKEAEEEFLRFMENHN